MSDRLQTMLSHLAARREAAVADLSAFLRIPSVSADPARAGDVRRCAVWLQSQLQACGLEATVEETPGHPIVLARNEHRSDRPTLLLYGHYDVQPPEPLDQWVSPAFEPVIRKTAAGTEALYARGATDDKGQLWTHVEAIRAWQAAGGVPVNLVVLVEGEEEVDSHHLADFVRQRRDALRADIAVISDTNQFARGRPAITYGLRGLVYSEVTFRAAGGDLHSGIHGGAVANPANALAKLLAGLQDENGRVLLPGFYDDVIELTPAERAAWQDLSLDEAAYAAGLGLAESVSTLRGEAGFTTLERRWGRPTFDICGLTAGYQGEGAKTIIPASATAKVSFRLVPGQDPMKVRAMLDRYLHEACPTGIACSVTHYAAATPTLVPADGPWVARASEAIALGFGAAPALVRDGLTIPVVNLLRQELGVDTLLLGFGLPDDGPHAPNEKIDLDALHNGARSIAAFIGMCGAAGPVM